MIPERPRHQRNGRSPTARGGLRHGTRGTLDLLDAYLAGAQCASAEVDLRRKPMTTEMKSNTTQAPANAIVIERTFEAPRTLVWRAWTEPEPLMRWWGPEHFTSPFCRMDLQVGGTYLFCMRDPEGNDYWSTGEYLEIVEPERLVFTDSFADAQGNLIPASQYGMAGDWPDALLVTVTLEDLEGRTRMTLRQEGLPEGEAREMTAAGWSGSFDKLAASLA
jgi:uncharacterized protein YndB with AHSA1/START domain